MQAIPQLPSTGHGVASNARASVRGSASATNVEPSKTAAEPGPSTVVRLSRGLANWNSDLQKQLSDAQQAQDFLDRTAAELEGLQANLRARLNGLDSEDGELQSKLQQLASTVQTRQASSAGSLDPQLRFSSPAGAAQRFKVRGLDLKSLSTGPGETLALTAGNSPSSAVSIAVTPGSTPAAIVQRFDQALAPTGIRASADASGALTFSVSESSWPATRDSLSIKGDGIRFPTGQFNRARTDPEPAAMQPQDWHKGNDADSIRKTLQQVLQAIDRVRVARAAVTQALARAAGQIDDSRAASSGPAAQQIADNFEATADRSDFGARSSVMTAVVGLSRSRVLSLLNLPPQS